MLGSEKLETSFQPVVVVDSSSSSSSSSSPHHHHHHHHHHLNHPKTSTLKLSNSFCSNPQQQQQQQSINTPLYASTSTYGTINTNQLKRSQTLRSYPRSTTMTNNNNNNYHIPSAAQQRNSSFMPNYNGYAHQQQCHQLGTKFSTISDENELNECDEVNDSSLLFTPSTTSSSSSSSSPSAIYSNNQILNEKSKPSPAQTTTTTTSTTMSTLRRSSGGTSSSSFRAPSTNNTHLSSSNTTDAQIGDLLRNHHQHHMTSKPVPPNRTSSLQYRLNNNPHHHHHHQHHQEPSTTQTLAAAFGHKQLVAAAAAARSSNRFVNNNNTNNNANDDRSSIYSSFSLRLSNLNSMSSYSLSAAAAAANNQQAGNNLDICLGNSSSTPIILTESDRNKIESCYHSIGSSVYAAMCAAELYTTCLESLIKLLDWRHLVSGVPVWVFNTGLNPKRPKGLSLVIADKRTGFALWKLNHITYANDLKWTKPGHITLKLSKSNLNDSSGLQGQNDQQTSFQRSIKKRSSFRQLTKLRPLTTSFTSASLSSAAAGESESNRSGGGEAAHLFMALKFDDDFECSKFYDFFRVLFTDSQNDDLFNPHYKPSLSSSSSSSSSNSSSSKQSSLIKVIYKKITKNSISSPVAFKVINSLSSVDEEALNNNNNSTASSNNNCLILSPDTQSIHSSVDLNTPSSSSILTLKRNLI